MGCCLPLLATIACCYSSFRCSFSSVRIASSVLLLALPLSPLPLRIYEQLLPIRILLHHHLSFCQCKCSANTCNKCTTMAVNLQCGIIFKMQTVYILSLTHSLCLRCLRMPCICSELDTGFGIVTSFAPVFSILSAKEWLKLIFNKEENVRTYSQDARDQ